MEDYAEIRSLVSENLNKTIDRCWFGRNAEEIKELEAKGLIYVGKVRDSFPLEEDTRAIIVGDSVSAFDVVAKRRIPFKGQVLNQTSNYWFGKTSGIIENHLIASPHPNVSIVHQCNPLPIEMIVRGYLTGSGWRDYQSGKFEAKYGIKLPEGLKKNQKLDEPILTPTTKAPRGQHDEAINRERALELVGDANIYRQIEESSLKIFEHGTRAMKSYDCIFVDTKFEFGMNQEIGLTLIDEINTSDSSRFWKLSTYDERLRLNQEPEKYDKEILRLWQIDQGRDPSAGADIPLIPLTDEITMDMAIGYVINYKNVTGKLPEPISANEMIEIEEILREFEAEVAKI